MKKTIILFIVFALIFSTFSFSVSAEESNFSVKISDVSKSIIQIKGKLPVETKIENRMITVLASDTMIDTAETGNFNSETTLALDYDIADADGSYSASFTFNRPSGKYWFYVLCDEYIECVDFDFISLSDLAQFVKSISDGSCGKEEIIPGIKERNNGFSLDFMRFNTEFRLDLLEYRLYTSKSKLTGTTDSEWLVSFSTLVDYAEREAAFLERLNGIGNYGEVYKILRDNAEFTDIDFSRYYKLSEAKQTSVAKAFLYVDFSNSEAVKLFFDQKVEEQQKLPGTNDGGGLGGGLGGGGGAGGGGNNNSPVPVIPSVTEHSTSAGRVFLEENSDVIFSDLAHVSWAEEAITNLCSMGIVNGINENEFAPDELVTREQFAKLLVLACDAFEEDAETDFSDAEKTEWYYRYIASAEKAGLTKGIGNNMFGVGNRITREDMSVMIYNAFRLTGKSLTVNKSEFADADSISDYARESVEALAGNGIINGVGNNRFAPKEYATRAQAAVLVYALVRR